MRKIFLLLFLVLPLGAMAQSKPVISILGDSYSTFEGYVLPDSNAVWYWQKPNLEATDVTDVKQTWWWQLIDRGGYKLGVNNSFSGATICYTGYRGADFTNRSFVNRATHLGSPDIILVFGATNDEWAKVPIGEFQYDNYSPADLKTFRPAVAYMLERLINHYPGTKTYFIVNTVFRPEIRESILTICRHYGVSAIELKDIELKSGHPTIRGMKSIANQVLEVLKKK